MANTHWLDTYGVTYGDERLNEAYEREYEEAMHREMWDEYCPGWEQSEIDPEARRFVDWSDVEDADWAGVRPTLIYVPGADE